MAAGEDSGQSPGDATAVDHSTETVRLVAIDYNMGGSIEELCDPAGATWYFRQAVSAMDRITGPAAETPVARSNGSSVLLGWIAVRQARPRAQPR